MTDKQALEVLGSWMRLAYHNADGTDESSAELYEALQTIFKLITRQQEEIDGLRDDLQRVCAERDVRTLTNKFVKSEAVKEFVDRLKEASSEMVMMCDNGTPISISYSISSKKLDSILKEMVGDKK